MSICEDFQTIWDYAHMWNWGPDWLVVADVYKAFPNAYSVLTPFAYSYLEELIRSRTSEYGVSILDAEGHERRRSVGRKLIQLARRENADDEAFLTELDYISKYFDDSSPVDGGGNRNNVAHGYLHPRYWSQEQFEQLISDIARISPCAGF